MKNNKNIIVLGGGTAGWMSANLLHLKLAPLGYQVRVIESEDIGIIGVGEGSTPQLKVFFDLLGIQEHDWMPLCDATYKYGIQFRQWCQYDPKRPFLDDYFHPFPASTDAQTAVDFMQACHRMMQGYPASVKPDPYFLTAYLSTQDIIPARINTADTQCNYGYHFDSYKLGAFLSKFGQQQGIIRNVDTITKVDSNEHGIKVLHGKNHTQYSAELFFDCSGFESVLLQKTLKVPFESFGNHLLNDAAIAIPTPRAPKELMQTQATALSTGWAWRIPLTSRVGNGYVYSSQYIDKEAAEMELRSHLGIAETIPARHLTMKVGQASKHWYKNCIGVGLAQGFIEPLEATALHLVQETVVQFIGAFLAGKETTHFQNAFNDNIRNRFNGIKDYITAHYCASNRNDTEYWQAASQPRKQTKHLKEILRLWRNGKDINAYITEHKLHQYYPTISWYCLLAGYQQFSHRQFEPTAQWHPHFAQYK